MKVAYVTPYLGEDEIVQGELVDHEVVFVGVPLVDHIPEDIKDTEVLSVFVDSRVTAEMMAEMPNLKVLALRSTGYDHVDVQFAKERGVVVSTVPHYGSQTVAEYALGLILSLSRRMYPAYDLLRTEGKVDVPRFEGFDLCGKTLGVIGTGAIGRRVCEMARGFRMNVLAYDLYPDEECAGRCGFVYHGLDEVLSQSDIITLHIPATPENKHLINRESLSKTKRGAYLINTARGDLVDTVALTEAIKSGHIAGAGLDVYEGERFIKDEMQLLLPGHTIEPPVWRAFVAEHELLDMEQVIVTPHLAFNTREAKREITDTTIENIKSALSDNPTNIV